MFDPGNHPESNLMFLLYVTCLMSAVDLHQDILRISVASPGNEHRLGANEAPPAIISMFLGEHISSILESFPNFNTSKKVALTSRNIKFIANFDSDTSDRNRTSPFAFTGNKFEFRMPGSSINLSCVNTMLNTAFADVLMNVCDELDNNHSETNIKKLITTLYKKHKRILFSGNGYSKE
jgi:glutamine synthetase